MRVTYITAGAAGTICGNCLKDNALAASLKSNGHDVVLLPAYTPLRTDETDVSEDRVVFGGINLYLQGKYRFFRSSSALDRLLDHPRLLRWTAGVAAGTDPADLGGMTRDTFRGESGPYRREIAKVVATLQAIEPEIVHLTNSMLACLAEPVRRELGVPVVCSLQGEADFLAGLSEPFRTECYELMRRHAGHVDRFVASCQDQARAMAPILGVDSDEIRSILPGISVEGFGERDRTDSGPFVIGFLARIADNKGLDLLAEAVELARQEHPGRELKLRVAGWRSAATQATVDRIRDRYGFDDLGYLDREDKIAFLQTIDAFSVPATYRASKGLYVLEALAAGVPVVQPRIGVFPELVDATGGGLTCAPNDSRDLASKLGELLADREGATRMGRAGRQAVLERFDAEAMAERTLRLYRRCMQAES